jgi:hypothetical protein
VRCLLPLLPVSNNLSLQHRSTPTLGQPPLHHNHTHPNRVFFFGDLFPIRFCC